MLEDWGSLQLTERHAGHGEAEQRGAEERGGGAQDGVGRNAFK